MILFRISSEFCTLNVTATVAGFEVPTAVTMKSSTVWDITACSPVKVNLRFGGTYLLHLQGRRASHIMFLLPVSWWFLAWLFDPEDGSDMLLRNGLLINVYINETKKNSVACSPQANYTDRVAAACWRS
jgi:hypothetical protein